MDRVYRLAQVYSTLRSECNLIVSGDDDDADAGIATVLDGVDDLLARRIQHTDHTDERAVRLRTTQHSPRSRALYSTFIFIQTRQEQTVHKTWNILTIFRYFRVHKKRSPDSHV